MCRGVCFPCLLVGGWGLCCGQPCVFPCLLVGGWDLCCGQRCVSSLFISWWVELVL